MSSRILPRTEADQAELLFWLPALGADPPPEAVPSTQSSKPPEPPPPPPSPVPSGPSWDEYRALDAKLRQMELQIPQREQAARAAGRQEGEASALAQWQQAIERTSRAVVEMAGMRNRIRREAEDDVVRLSMAMARRILRRELTMDPEALLGVVKAALERIDIRETHKVRVRTEDCPVVAAHLERIGSPHRVEVVSDPTLERGGVVFETERGNMDGSVETQLEEIERGFVDLLGRKRE